MKIPIFVLAVFAGLTYSQFVNNIHIMGHIPYMISILQEVVTELENREWCNLKVPDITNTINETIFENHYEGTVTYFNGFVSSMQWIDILQAGVDQNWAWNNTDETGTVHVRGTLRMLDMALGYDVNANLNDEHHRYTMTITYPLTSFTFNIWRNVNTEAVRVEVVGVVTTPPTINRINFMPRDNMTDVLITLFGVRQPDAGVLGWANDVFPSIALDAYNKIEFPRICYHCPLASTMTDIIN